MIINRLEHRQTLEFHWMYEHMKDPVHKPTWETGMTFGDNYIAPKGSEDVAEEYLRTGNVPEGYTAFHRGHGNPQQDTRLAEYKRTIIL